MGHPIHPMLIPFPITFLTAALATDVAARTTEDPFWSRTSRWMLGAGIVTGLIAGAVGAIDYFTIRRAREKSVGKLHAYGNPLRLVSRLLTLRCDRSVKQALCRVQLKSRSQQQQRHFSA
jgi:uncharacterized membrane protein